MHSIDIPSTDAPSIPGLIFRPYQGATDLAAMLAVVIASECFDGEDNGVSLESLQQSYTPSQTFDPHRDTIIAEVAGAIVGYARVRWWSEINNGPLNYETWGCLMPEWRRRGIGRAMLRWLERRAYEMAGGHAGTRVKHVRGFASPAQIGRIRLLDLHGYQPIRHSHIMVRPTLEGIPDFPLPDGLEMRPAEPAQFRAIWDAARDAFLDHWGAGEQTENDYQEWLADPQQMQPALWQIAWDKSTNQVAGQVRAYINPAENQRYQRLRGFTEYISVGRPWRRRGLARALIALSLRVQRAHGMTESELGVDSANTSGANRVYTDCGFQVVKTHTTYQKAMLR